MLCPAVASAAAVVVDEVDAGHRAADGEAGLARERVEHRLQLERDVERVGGARERLVALGLRDAAALGVEPGEPERGLVGERLGEQDLVGAPGAPRARRGRDVAHVAGPRERDEQAPRRLEPRRRASAPSSGAVRASSSASERAVAATWATAGASGSAAATTSTRVDRQRAPRLGGERGEQLVGARTPTGPPRRGGAAGRARHALGYVDAAVSGMTAFGRRAAVLYRPCGARA